MKVYDSQGRLKVVGFTGPPGTQSVTCAELSATASLLSVAIDVVSNGLSDLISAHNVLSNRVSTNSTVATPSVTSAEVQVVSAQAASAIASEVSNRMSADAALSAAITIVSNAASVADVHASTASAAATSADAHANTVSARVVSVSAELASLVQIASAAATSADAHANTASAAATSADAHANTVSARVVSVSAELVSLVQIASAAATSADAHANTASAAATSADAHANAASAAATSVDGRIASLSAGFASLSARSVGDVSTHGFQSIFNALSNRISANTGGAGSVTSTELSVGLLGILQLRNDDGADASAGHPVFVGASAASTFRIAAGLDTDTKEAIGMVTSTILIGATGSIQTRGVLSLTSAQWDERTGQTGGLTIGSKYYLASAIGQLALTPPSDAARAVGVAIDGNKMLLNFDLVDDARPYISAISARAFGNNSVHGFQSVVNALSDRISAASASVTSQEMSVRVQVASAAATSADNHANTVSARLVSVSAELVSLVQIASAAATSADGHANTVSVAANVISARLVSVSAELASLVQIASAAATSADAHANTASAAATSADAHANAASAAATSVDARIASLSAGFASLSARSVGDVSTHGFQSILNALSNRISAGGGGSVTSVEAQGILSLQNLDVVAISAGAPAFIRDTSANTFGRANGNGGFPNYQVVGLVIDNSVAVSAVGRIQTRGVVTLTTGQWDNITGATGGLTIGSTYYLTTTAGRLSESAATVTHARPVGIAKSTTELVLLIGAADTLDNGTVSNNISIALNKASALSTLVFTSVSARSVGDVSTKGLQSALDAISNRVSGIVAGAASATSQEISVLVQAASAAATSADGHANTVSARVVSVSAELASLLASTSAALRADITSTSAVIKADINSVSAAIMADAASHLASTSAAIKADINSVSAAIMADAASHLASTSAAIKADINSVSAAIINEVSVQYGRGQFRRVTGAQAIATATFTKVSGLSLSIEGSGFYEIHGQLVWSQSGAGSASAIFNFGMSMTAQPTMAAFRMMGNAGNFAASASIVASVLPFQIQFGGASAICATPSIMYSAKPNPGASGSVAVTMFFDGVLAGSTVQSQLKVVVATSTGAFGVNIQPGSYIRAFRIG